MSYTTIASDHKGIIIDGIQVLDEQQAAITPLTDNSGGVDPEDDTIAEITETSNAGSADTAPVAAAITQLAVKLAAVIDALEAHGLIEDADA